MKSVQWCFQSVALVILNEISLFAVLCFVTELHLKDLSNGHNIVGDSITLQCSVQSSKPQVSLKWMAPLNLNLTMDRINITTVTRMITNTENSTSYITTSLYTIDDFQQNDQSLYYCAATEADNPFDRKYRYIWVPAYDVEDNLIEFHKYLTIVDKPNAEVRVHIRAHPEATFYWLDNNNKTIPTNSIKFLTATNPSNDYTNYESILKFNNILFEDFGNYTIIGKNEYGIKTYTIAINMTGRPTTSVKVVNKEEGFSVIKCQSASYPKPNITWQFEQCEDLSCFGSKFHNNNANISKKSEFKSEDNGLQKGSYIIAPKSDLGLIRGIGENSFGKNNSIQYIYRVDNGFQVFAQNMIKNGSLLKIETLFKEDIEMICAVSLDDYHHEIKWWRNGRNFSLDDIRVPIKGFDEYEIKKIDAVYSSISVVKVNIDKTDEGNYTCQAFRKDGKIDHKVIQIIAKEQSSLNVASNMQNKTVVVKFGGSIKFFCNVDGYPTPYIKWYKNNKSIKSTERINIKDHNQTLAINNIETNDNGTYKCEASNRRNESIIHTTTLQAIPAEFDWLLFVIVLLVCVLVCVTIFIIIKIRKEQKLKKELEALGLANFEEGAIEHLNPELRLDDQADLLPYDKKWEIPAKNLTLGKELGSGAFGVVVQGELSEFPTKGNNTTVAVKMVNKFAGDDCIRALASELKIMVHLGQHVNIVNLIGACTQDIVKKKLLVVVEFCALGNLHEHILYNSNNFVDQRANADDFDWTIRSTACEKKSPTKKQIDVPKLQYSTLSFSSTGSSECSDNEQSQYSRKENPTEPEKPICSQDFLVWGFQIARGMEYLASRRVLHGDLAARNVLLTENNVVKISDFGLSRSMYKNGIYKKKANGPLPVKWMALESIGENIFSTQSDVWSFGVTLWELFSLAKTPYPGMPVDQVFYNKLFSGYRLERPEFATAKIYEIMFDCWNANPMKRPSFTQLAERIGAILEEPVKNHYIDMNSPYVVMNNQNSDSNQKDYLLIINKPDFENEVPSLPNYANNINYFHSAKINMGYVNDKID